MDRFTLSWFAFPKSLAVLHKQSSLWSGPLDRFIPINAINQIMGKQDDWCPIHELKKGQFYELRPLSMNLNEQQVQHGARAEEEYALRVIWEGVLGHSRLLRRGSRVLVPEHKWEQFKQASNLPTTFRHTICIYYSVESSLVANKQK